MARHARFAVKNTKRGWRVNVPASISQTGIRVQRFFPTREKAAEFSKELRENNKEFGSQAKALSPAASGDATAALEVLKPFGVTLSQAASFYVEHHDMRSKAPTVAEAWDSGMTRREKLSPRYRGALKNLKRRLPLAFQNKNLMDVVPHDLEIVLGEITNGPTAWKNALRTISAIFGDQVDAGTIRENPCSRVQVPKVRAHDEVRIYSPEEAKALFAACKDYDDKSDRKCSACAVPFAFLAFAGLRPTELTRLRWEDVMVDQSNIRLGGRITKTGKTRNVRINETLRAWIETVPLDDRRGRIVPGRWLQRATRVRAEAGLDGLELQDALRHSYGSYMLATENDLNSLKNDMGHQHCAVFFNHYHNAVTKDQAAPYWAILPGN